MSPLNPTAHANHNLLNESFAGAGALAADVRQAFVNTGRLIEEHLPGHPERRRAYVLDAIVDNDDRVWFLEINCNPQLHPDIYPMMLGDEMGVRHTAGEAGGWPLVSSGSSPGLVMTPAKVGADASGADSGVR